MQKEEMEEKERILNLIICGNENLVTSTKGLLLTVFLHVKVIFDQIQYILVWIQDLAVLTSTK